MIRYGFRTERLSYTEEEVDNLYPALLRNYNRTIDQNSHLYDGIVTVLENLNTAGWNIGVCTNKPELQANSLLKKLGIRSYFKSFIGSDTVGAAKPNSKPLLAAIELAGGIPSESVLVGDTKTDRDTATAAGVKCLLVNYGHGALVYDLKTLNPEGIVNKAHEIPEALASLLKSS
jgi:phosphoglycolate phosphatase